MTSDFPLVLKVGFGLSMGEMRICSEALSKIKNSSKVIVIVREAKWIDSFGGECFNTRGGVSSFFPPLGDVI